MWGKRESESASRHTEEILTVAERHRERSAGNRSTCRFHHGCPGGGGLHNRLLLPPRQTHSCRR